MGVAVKPRAPVLSMMALALFLISAGTDRAAGAPNQATQASFDGQVVRIKTFVEIYGQQATDALAAVIEAEINSVWQDPANQQSYCGFPVEFEAEVRVRQGDGTDGWHQIKIRRMRRGQYFRDYVGGGNPFTGDVAGQWSPFNDLEADRFGRTIYAHEAGHLFGSADEYIEGGWFTRSKPVPGRESTLMADNVPWVDAYTVNNILQSAFPEGGWDLPRCIQGTTFHELTIRDGGHERTGFLTLDVTLKTSESGDLRGSAVGEFTLAGSYQDSGCEFIYNTAADIDLDIAAQGQGNGPYTIESEVPILVDEVQRHALCGDPVDLVIEWEVSLLLEDVVFGELTQANEAKIGGRYHLDETTDEGKRQADLWLNGIEGQ
ncbi:MAG TPA: hypothetical protein VFI11_07395 [Anaerolineales bacterium]|nr:hypothetical protein [Anaerolineales bacterium]